LPAEQVRELVIMPEVSRITDVPDYVRGVINLRGRVVPVIDLRRRIGMSSAHDEIEQFCEMMTQRQQDHLNWLHELEASVREEREFKLTTDPHRCAFGKWYDAYQPDNPWVAGLLRRFDGPHQAIHALGGKVVTLTQEGRHGEALELIAVHHGSTLALMVNLFEELQVLVRERQREVAVVLMTGKREFAVSVDAAVSVEKLAAADTEALPMSVRDGLVEQVWKNEAEKRMVLMIAAERLLGY
jgi:purine-binding chemotaxis protein CheW